MAKKPFVLHWPTPSKRVSGAEAPPPSGSEPEDLHDDIAPEIEPTAREAVIFDTPTLAIPASLRESLEEHINAFDVARALLLMAIEEQGGKRKQTVSVDDYLSKAAAVLEGVVNASSGYPDRQKHELFAKLREEFVRKEEQAFASFGRRIDLAKTLRGSAILSKPERTGHRESPDVPTEVARALAENPLSIFEDIDTSIAEEFSNARAAYFSAYYEHHLKKAPGTVSKKLKIARARYNAALTKVAKEARNVPAGEHGESSAWAQGLMMELVDELVAGETERLAGLWNAARGERKAALAEKLKSKRLRRLLLTAVAGIGVQAMLSEEVSHEPQFAYTEAGAPTPERSGSIEDGAKVTRIEISTPAKAEGPNDMLLRFFKELKQKDADGLVYATLAGGEDVKPFDAAKSIALGTGLWERTDSANRSALLMPGDHLVLDKAGDIIFVGARGDEHPLTRGGKPVPPLEQEDWLTFTP